MIDVFFMRMYQYKNGYYYVAFQGNQRRSLKTKDKTVANRLFKRLRREVLNKNIILLDKNKNINLDDFIKEYLEYSKAHKAKSTYVRDRYSLRILCEHLGNVLMKSITSENLDKFHTDLINW